MVDISTFLLILIYFLCSILLVSLIVLIIKLIKIVNRFNGILDEVDNKIAKLDKAFHIVDIITDNMAIVSDKIVDTMSSFVRRLFSKDKNRKVDEINEK